MKLFLCGDVMTGRGIDQILPHPGDPRLHEASAKSALEYVGLAEKANGPIPRPVGFADVWGKALAELDAFGPDARIINLETAVTRSDEGWPGKEVRYRMHPENVPCLTVARIDCCVLANNHVLDFGSAGLAETLDTLAKAGLETAGAGRDLAEARRPALIDRPAEGRVLVFGLGSETSGIPRSWAARVDRPGVDLLEDLSEATAVRVGERIRAVQRAGDVVVVSLHWGSNWGWEIPETQRLFAHALVRAGADVVHGHSSHHPRPIEVFEGKLILYGCGDFLNDYEGIRGYEWLRNDLTLMYLATVDPGTGRLAELRMVPWRIRNFRLNRASREDAVWLGSTLDRESRGFGVRVEVGTGDQPELRLRWPVRLPGPCPGSDDRPPPARDAP